MTKRGCYLFLGVASCALSSAVRAETTAAVAASAAVLDQADRKDAAVPPAKKPEEREVFSTGVAKGRDILDSAISTSSLRESEINRLSARSLAEIFHNIAGVRSEVVDGETNATVTIRGLPAASTGAKFLQLQEDGLPVVEFGDMNGGGADEFIRADLSLGQIEAIRGGSASTFASNSPGGVINMISKTGDVEGGSIMASTGVDYDEKRADFDYGTKINDTLHFHVGGFYRQGEGPRRTGFDAVKGGQFKLNVTKEFTGGHIRLYAKYLNDRTPVYLPVPMTTTGSNSDPKFTNVENFDVNHDTLLSRYQTKFLAVDGENNPTTQNIKDGQHSIVKSVGLEAQADLAGWTFTERFRYSGISGSYTGFYPTGALSSSVFGGAGLTYADGPNAGQAADPATLGGNGLIALSLLSDIKIKSFDNLTNDLRASHSWDIGGGDLTTTAGFYKSRQDVDQYSFYTSQLSTVEGNGRATLINVGSGAAALTQNGVIAYNDLFFGGQAPRRRIDVRYNTNAAFGSLNYHIGHLSVGGSLRYDFGDADGQVFGASLFGVPASGTLDVNGDGVISGPERQVGLVPLTGSPVDYHWHYLSYSVGVNYRLSTALAAFARYSRGGRTNADRLLFNNNVISPVTGKIIDGSALIDNVRQLEGGVKFRRNGLALNATAFLANTQEHQTYFANIARTYRTYGVEFEGGYRHGILALAAGATYTHGEISADDFDPTVVGNRPMSQPKLFGFVRPSIDTERFSIGVNVYGITNRYATDNEGLKLPGYVQVNPFVQFRPFQRLTLSLNVNNAFDTKGISRVNALTSPSDVSVINGRTISSSVRFDF